jgi:hypothetical protein
MDIRITKRKIACFAAHSAWGAASNFNEMFNLSGIYDAYEILFEHPGKKGYEFGAHMNHRKLIGSNQADAGKIRDIVLDPGTIFFVFDIHGMNMLMQYLAAYQLDIRKKPVNVFWTGTQYMLQHEKWNEEVKTFNINSYAMLDLLRFGPEAHPLMQPYNLSSTISQKGASENFTICHSPGKKAGSTKGTEVIGEAVEKLIKRTGDNNIVYNLIGGPKPEDRLSHSSCLDIKANSDVFVDKIGRQTVGGIGKSGIEALCMGIPTISSMHNTSFWGRYEDFFVMEAYAAEELEEKLFLLYTEKKFYDEMAEKTVEGAKIFSYENTFNYLEKTMKK